MKREPHDRWKNVLAERVKFIRVARKLTQNQLAAKAGIGQSTLALIEVAKKDPSLSTLGKIAIALETDIATLFASPEVFVFDMSRLRAKYKSEKDLTPHLYEALGRVVQYAKDIGFVR